MVDRGKLDILLIGNGFQGVRLEFTHNVAIGNSIIPRQRDFHSNNCQEIVFSGLFFQALPARGVLVQRKFAPMLARQLTGQ